MVIWEKGPEPESSKRSWSSGAWGQESESGSNKAKSMYSSHKIFSSVLFSRVFRKPSSVAMPDLHCCGPDNAEGKEWKGWTLSGTTWEQWLYMPVWNGICLHSAALETPKHCNKRCVKVAQTLFSLCCSNAEKWLRECCVSDGERCRNVARKMQLNSHTETYGRISVYAVLFSTALALQETFDVCWLWLNQWEHLSSAYGSYGSYQVLMSLTSLRGSSSNTTCNHCELGSRNH